MSFDDLLKMLALAESEEPAYCELLREHRFDEAVPLLHQQISRDDPAAMGYYGSLLVLGKGIERDLEGAVAWFREGALRGDPHSQLALGVCLASGIGVAADQSKAAYWLYRVGVTNGHPEAILQLSNIVGRNPGVVGEYFSIEDYFDLMQQLRPPGRLHS